MQTRFVRPEVLVVCPSAAGRTYLGIMLNRIWYHPLLLRTIDDVPQAYLQEGLSLALLDGDLPGEDLLKTVRIMLTHPGLTGLPLIVFVPERNRHMTDTLIDLGCAAILPRPIDLPATYATLARLTGQPRRQARIPLTLDITISEEAAQQVLVCTTLSEGGMFVRTHDPLPLSRTIGLRFALPGDGEPISCSAEVMHHRPLGDRIDQEPGMGLRFRDLTDTDLDRIRRFVHRELLGDLMWV